MADSDFVSLQSIYKSIVELTEKHKSTFSPLYILALMLNISLIIKTLYDTVQILYEENNERSVPLIKYILAAESFTILLAPAVAASMLATQADRIVVILLNKLMQIRDESISQDIVRFTKYVEARDCRLRVYKVIPLDADLTGMVLGFCVTYLIVILQFKYK